MAQPIARYDGDYITCYPGSNQTDNGKLNLELNMARIVTRLSSKNFCIVKPSFELAAYVNQDTNLPQIEVNVGECSINGMDLIMTQRLYIDPPTEPGFYHLAFKLARDSSSNVIGDLIYGVTTTFEGVYLTYYDNKPDPMDPDMLFLGSLNWDGERFTDITEDEDKYGRLWAEDILCKIEDPKHPDERRLNLQEWLKKVPDWYFSKEGDTIYGPLILADSRDSNNPGIMVNVDEDGSHLSVKEPGQENDKLQFYGDLNRDGIIDQQDADLMQQIIDGTLTPSDLQKHLGDVNHDGIIDEKDLLYLLNFIKQEGNYGDTGNIYFIDENDKDLSVDVQDGKIEVGLKKAKIFEDESDDELHIHNDGGICMDAEGEMKFEADGKLSFSTEKTDSPVFEIDDDKISITDPTSPDLSFNFELNNDIAKLTMGKAIWQYNNTDRKVSLLQDNVSYLNVVPDADFVQHLRVQDTIYIGSQTIYGKEQTYLKSMKWKLSDATVNPENYIEFDPNTITMINPDGDESSYIHISNKDKTRYSRLYDNGVLELQNPSDILPSIVFKDGNGANTATIEKIKDTNKLNIKANVDIQNNLVVYGTSTGNGLITTNGVVTFKNGANDASITKLPNNNTLYTSSDLKVGSSGNAKLFAGNTTVNGYLYVGASEGDQAELKIDPDGNLVTTGTIKGAKVYNSVYNDYGEIFRKSKDEIIEYGDIVYMGSDGLVHKVNTVSDLNLIIGICSDTMGVVLGGEDIPKDEQVPVGMVGQIKVKTNSTLITPGRMVKALPDGTVDVTNDPKLKFGIAMENVIDGRVKIIYK